MRTNPNNYISINEILADVTVALDDQDYRLLTPGFYRAQVKKALDELGFDTFFYDFVEDKEMPDDLQIPIPEGAFNVKGIYLIYGTPDNIKYQENLYWKRDFYTEGEGKGYTATRHHRNVSDPFMKPVWNNKARYFFNIHNGIIMLSDLCKGYDYVRIKASGIPSKNIDNVKMIPPEAREGITLWVIEKCASYLKIRYKEYRTVQLDAYQQLDPYGLNGAWHKTRMRLKAVDKKQLRDTILYNKAMYY